MKVTRKVKRVVSSCLGCVMALTTLAFPSHAQSNSQQRQRPYYECKQTGSGYVTMMNVSDNGPSYPVISWGNQPQSGAVSSDYHQRQVTMKETTNEFGERVLGPVTQAVLVEGYDIDIQERCRSVSSRLDQIASLSQSPDLGISSGITLKVGRVPPKELVNTQGIKLRDLQGEPLKSAPWVVCATVQSNETCDRVNMLFTLPIEEPSVDEQQRGSIDIANQFLSNFTNLITNPSMNQEPLKLQVPVDIRQTN